MPKCYSEQERAYIIRRLKEEAADCLGRYGVRRTTVDELVRRVRIPKGTFYLFYASKELLLFEVIVEQHEALERWLLESLAALDPAALTVDSLTDLFLGMFATMAENPALKLLNTGEVELLARRLPPETVAAHMMDDSSMLERVFSLLPMRRGVDVENFHSAFLTVFLAAIQEGGMGLPLPPGNGALRLLIRGLVLQLL